VSIDNALISEAYKKIHEGMLDKLKAHAADIKGSTVGLGKNIRANIRGATASLRGDKEAHNQAMRDKEDIGDVGKEAKTNSIVNSHVNKLKKAFTEYTNDLVELDLLSQEDANWYNTELLNILDATINKNLVQNLPVPEKPKLISKSIAG